MDYGKYKYELAKKEKEARKNQKVINVKEVRMTPTIEDHDLNVKAKKTIDFLKGGDRVKVTVRFRGRELGHAEVGKEVLMRFAELIADHGIIEKQPVMEGRNMVMYLASKKD